VQTGRDLVVKSKQFADGVQVTQCHICAGWCETVLWKDTKKTKKNKKAQNLQKKLKSMQKS